MPTWNRRQFTMNSAACGVFALRPFANISAVRPPADRFAKLRSLIKGDIIDSQSSVYEEARYTWNRRFDRHPTVIVQCADADDARRALDFAESEKMVIALRSGGHSLGALSTCDSGMVIDLGRMNAIRVDERSRTVTVQPGARIGAVKAAAQAKGLVANLPQSNEIGTGGTVLAAAIGCGLSGMYGNAALSLLAAECILPDRSKIIADATQQPDLLWGLRGAGANFAIATELTLKLYEAPQVYEFSVLCPPAAIPEIVHRLQTEAAKYTKQLDCGAYAFGSAGTASEFVAMGSFFGGEAEGKAIAARLTKGIGEAKVNGQFKNFVTPGQSSPVRKHYGFARWAKNIGPLKEDVLKTFFESREKQPFERFTALNMSYGADTEVSADEAAFGLRPAGVDAGIWADAAAPEDAEAAGAWTRDLWDLIKGESYGGFPSLLGFEGEIRVKATYEKSYDRLRKIKTKYDPGNLLQLNQNILPA